MVNLCESCIKAGQTECHYCSDFIAALTYPVKKASVKKINISSGEDAINTINTHDNARNQKAASDFQFCF